MIGNRNTQTAFRFREELLERAKLKARREKKSLNSYVEELIEKDLGSAEDNYERVNAELRALKKHCTKHPDLEALLGCAKGISFTREELDRDPKLDYLAGKYGLNMEG